MSDSAKLKKLNEKRIKTAFIGAISTFERQFCYLWGGNVDEYGEMTVPPREQMLSNERKFYDMYLQFRAEVLRLGNNQVRLSNNDINSFDVKWNGLEIVFRAPGLTGQEKHD